MSKWFVGELETPDVFICHATEDKVDVASPLHDELKKSGLTVWYDQYSLKLGDSLRESIEYGLARSEYGVVILSEAFFSKPWTKSELDALHGREMGEARKVVLPVWHKVDEETVRKHLPMLAGKRAVSTSCGIPEVAQAIIEVVGGRSGGIVPLPGQNSGIGRFPVTNAEYARFVSEGGYAQTGQQKWWSTEGREWLAAYRERRPSDYIFGALRTEDLPFDTPLLWENGRFKQIGQPVVGVSWFEAQAYCTWLSQRSGITVRLPTEEEWMFAAVGNSSQPFPWGSAPPTRDVANIDDESGRPNRFGEFLSGESWLECQDMVGNVWEWCQDWLGSQQSHLADEPLSVAKILGGCYPDSPDRFADGISRAYRRPGYRHGAIGFRILMEQVNTNAMT